MRKEEWHDIYIKRITEATGSPLLAKAALEAAIESGDIDYSEDPLSSAEDELSYWVE